ncbi:MAG: Clp protease N-terminal domain-containing protein [Planctomycetota bacterium]|jgi:ATP-dependent Clp protease ATP-binding subunit ClpA
MNCQKCNHREAVTFTTEVRKGQVRTFLVCNECFLPQKEGAFSRLTHEARRALLKSCREMTDPKSANRIRPAMLYFLLENENSLIFEAIKSAGVDPSVIREEVASFLAGENPDSGEWVSMRGITPALIGSRAVAQRLESDVIGTEHVFLGLIESPEPGDPMLMINLAGRTGDIEKHLLAVAALTY